LQLPAPTFQTHNAAVAAADAAAGGAGDVADCSDAVSESTWRRDGVYVIRPDAAAGMSSSEHRTARVYCEADALDGTGWTLIQRRLDGAESFARGWDDYAAGFGDPSADYWLGKARTPPLGFLACILRIFSVCRSQFFRFTVLYNICLLFWQR